MMAAALDYISRDRKIFPCNINKRPLIKNGFKAATTDQDIISEWWAKNPNASIGAPTGDGLLVLDIDLPDGQSALDALEKENSPLPQTLEQRTGSGGRHLFFSVDTKIKNSAGKLGVNLDIRGDGGYIILPPSNHESGNHYEWTNKNPIAEAPKWLIRKLTAQNPNDKKRTITGISTHYGQKALVTELAELTGTSEGSRNHRLNQAAFSLGQLVAGGELDQGQVEAALQSAAVSIGLSSKEAEVTLHSGLEAGRQKPRTAPPSNKSTGEILHSTSKQISVKNIDSVPPQEDTTTDSLYNLPPYPPELSILPSNLGSLQDFIFNRMTYPSLEAAGMAALATITSFAQTNITIKSRDGLGLNEYYLFLMPTGFGKEDLRKPPEILKKQAEQEIRGHIDNVVFRHAMPASQQGIHQLAESNRSIMFLADEFAEWIRLTHKDATKQAALGYMMQTYTKATGTVEPGHAVTKDYHPVENPRLSVMATSTAEAMFETMTKDQADTGAYNRLVIFAGDEELPKKKYTGLVYKPEQNLVDFIAWICDHPPGTEIDFSPEGFQEYILLDDELAEPIKRQDGILGGRLAEQAIKIAALFALANKRLSITAEDMRRAFAIRIGLYHRSAELAHQRGRLDGLHHTTRALKQVSELFQRVQGIYSTQLGHRSRLFNALNIIEQKMVIERLISDGIVELDSSKRRYLCSLVYSENAA